MLSPSLQLAWIPFYEPLSEVAALNVHENWWLTLLPMAFLVSMGYKAVRLADLSGYWRAVFVMMLQVLLAMVLLGAGFFVLVEVLIPVLDG